MLNKKSINFSPLMAIVLLGLILFFIYIFFKGLFALASYVMPVLVIATLIMDYKVYVDYGKSLINLVQKNVLWGIGAIALTFLAFPLVILFLFSKVLIKKFALSKINNDPRFQKQRNAEDDYIEYEEIDDDVPSIELPQIEPDKPKAPKNPFDEYFN